MAPAFLCSRIVAAALLVTVLALAVRLYRIDDRMTHVDDIGWVATASGVRPGLDAAKVVAGCWTYAPGQFVLASRLIRKCDSWRDFLVRVRLPSAVAGALGLGLFAFVLARMLGPEFRVLHPAFAISMVLGIVSLRAIIEAQQGYTYAITALLVAVPMVALLDFPRPLERPWAWRLRAFIAAVGAAAGIWFSYQTVVVVAAVLLVLGCVTLAEMPRMIRDVKFLAGHVAAWIIILVAVVGTIFPAYRYFIKQHIDSGIALGGVWARADFPPPSDGKPLSTVAVEQSAYALGTLNRVFAYGLTPIWPDAIGHDVLTGVFGPVLATLALLGSLGLLRRGVSRNERILGGASVAIVLGFLAGNLLRRFPLGVTRHSHILMLPSLALISLGLAVVCRVLAGGWRRLGWGEPRLAALSFAGFAGAAAILACFVGNYPAFHEATRNRVDMDQVARIARERGVDEILALDFTWDPLVWLTVFRGAGVPTTLIHSEGEIGERVCRLEGADAAILVVDHRADPKPRIDRALLDHPNLEVLSLVAIAPRGSTELIGDINGGNGCFLILIRPRQSVGSADEPRSEQASSAAPLFRE